MAVRLTTSVFLIFIVPLFAACSGSSPSGQVLTDDQLNPGEQENDGGINSPDSTENGSDLFFEERPIVDPYSTREEIAARTVVLLEEYRVLMSNVFSQVDEVYRTIGSGLESSNDPWILSHDIELYETINNNCTPVFDSSGITLIGIESCFPAVPKFAYRHPIYKDVSITIEEYTPGANFDEKAETSVSIYPNRGADIYESMQVTTGTYQVNTNSDDDLAEMRLTHPAYLGPFGESCQVFLNPITYPIDELNVNGCSEMIRYTTVVLKRLNN